MYTDIYTASLPPELLAMAETPVMQRLLRVGMHCGCEYTAYPIYRDAVAPYSRYTHSLGTAAIVCFPGIMYRGGAEKKIRQYLIDNNFIDCIIQLPGNLFFGTSIATCIMVLKKSKAENKTLFVDASKEFVKVTNNNKLTEDNIAKIVASFVDREDKDYFCRLVPNDEIAAQDYNLSVSTYVEQEDTREVINITELNAEIKRIVAREQVLRDEIDKIIAEIEQ